MSLEEWMNSYELFKKYKYQLNKKFKLVKNEDLSQNTKEEMKKISKWLKVDYNNGLLKSTYPSGAKWVPDSCYITKDQYNNIEKFPGTIDNFFDPKLPEWEIDLEVPLLEKTILLRENILHDLEYFRISLVSQ